MYRPHMETVCRSQPFSVLVWHLCPALILLQTVYSVVMLEHQSEHVCWPVSQQLRNTPPGEN